MNKKRNVIIVFVIIIIVVVIGLFYIINNKAKDYLDGIYVFSQNLESGDNAYYKKTRNIDVITFYPNNSFSSYQVKVNDIEKIGVEVSKTQVTTGTYVLSNESKTVLLNYSKKNEVYSFENYKVLKNENKELSLLKGSLEDFIPKDTINNRVTDLTGEYVYEKVEDYKSGMTYSGVRNEPPIQIGTRYIMEFKNNGTLSIKVEGFQNYSNNEKIIVSGGNYITRYYSMNKESNELYVYSTSCPYNFQTYEKYNLSNDFKEITTERGEVFKLVK